MYYRAQGAVPKHGAGRNEPEIGVDFTARPFDNAAMRSFPILSFCRFLEARHTGLLLALLGAVLLGGAAYSLHLGDRIRYPDEQEYASIGANLAEHGVFSTDGVQATAYRPPGYPALLAVLRSAGTGVFSMRMLNFAALAVCVLLLYRLLRPLSVVAALLAAACAAAYPLFLYTAGTLYPQTVASALFLAAIWLVFRRDPPGYGDAALAGLAMGALILTVPSFVFSVVFVAGWWVVRSRRLLTHAVVLVLACGLVLAPWIVRNYVRFGTFVFVSSNSGYNLLLGNSENARPNSGTNADIRRYEAAAANMGEIDRDRYYGSQAVSFIRGNPGRAAWLYARKFLNYFNYRNELFVKTEGSPLRDAVAVLTYGPLLAMALLRVLLARKWPLTRLEHFALLLYVLNGAYAAIFFTRLRFRVPFDYLLLLVAGLLLGRLAAAMRSRPDAVLR